MDAIGRALWTLLLLLLLLTGLPGAVAAQSTAHPNPRRDGLWLSGGLGTGVGEGGVGGLAGNFAVGWTLSPRFLLGVGSSAVRA